jgi:hypothetical protein
MQVARAERKLREWRTAEDHVGTCLLVGDNSAKALLIPHTLGNEESFQKRRESGPRPIRWLVG